MIRQELDNIENTREWKKIEKVEEHAGGKDETRKDWNQ